MADFRQHIIDGLENNTFVVFADANGAQLFSKLRGATAAEIGVMIGSIYAAMDRQFGSLRVHIERQGGADGVAAFDGGIKEGRERAPYNEGIQLRERKPR